MTEPDIFVVVPVYQGHEVIAETLRSIRDQTYEHFRVLVSIDGDDPASLEACRPFAADPRFSLVDGEARQQILELSFPDAVYLPDINIPDKRRIAVGLSRVSIRPAA